MACGCPQDFSLNLFVNSDCNPPDPNVFCSNGFRVYAPGADPNQGPGPCPIDVGLNAGCSSLTPGCSYVFVAPSGRPAGRTVAHFIWTPQAPDVITFTGATVQGIENVSPPGGAVWNPNSQTITNIGNPVEFDLVVKGPSWQMSYSSAANATDLEICQIDYQN